MHFSVLKDGREAAVKILRPGIARTIAKDVSLLYAIAGILRRVMKHGELLDLREVVA